jgi:uncharacterized membrane protein
MATGQTGGAKTEQQGQSGFRFGRIVIGLILLGLCFRLAHLEQKVFWVDEVATAIRIAGHTRTQLTDTLSDGQIRRPADLLAYQHTPAPPLSQTFAALRQSPEHAPLYFLFLRFWASLFGSSVVALRSFSVLCSLLLIGVMSRLAGDLGRELNRDLAHDLAGRLVDKFPGGPRGGFSGEFSGKSNSKPAAVQIADGQNARFTAGLAAGLAASLTALSPLLIAYGQEARPYSLWLLLLALNSWLLRRALRLNQKQAWGLYGLTLVLSCYTSLLTVGVALGQMLYVSFVWPQHRRRLGWVGLGAGAALLPWLGLIGQNWQMLQHNTTWMRLPLSGFAKLATWFYTVAILYFDVPVVTQPIWIAVATLICAASVVTVIGLAFYWVYKMTAKTTWLFILTLAFSLPISLIGLDLVINGRYSTAPRYWLPFHLGAQLAVALWLAAIWNQNGNQANRNQLNRNQLNRNQPGRQPAGPRAKPVAAWLAAFLIAVCLVSNLLHLETSPRYLKTRSLNNPAIAEVINQAVAPELNPASHQADRQPAQPLLLAESQNTMDLLSLSHHLDPQTQIQLLPSPNLLAQIQQLNSCTRPVFLFNPSPELQQQMQQANLSLSLAYRPQLLFPGEFALSLWRLVCP